MLFFQHRVILLLKHSKEVGVKYMQMQEILKHVEQDARAEGMEQGMEQGAMALVKVYQEFNAEREAVVAGIAEKLQISQEQAKAYVEKFWIEK